MDFETVTMSGTMPASSKEKKAPVRPQPSALTQAQRERLLGAISDFLAR